MIERQKRIYYKLYLEGSPLGFEDHDDGTQILIPLSGSDEGVFKAKTYELAISAICDNFFFHHGCGDLITPSTPAKKRLQLIQVVKVEEIINQEFVETRFDSIPNNKELAEYYKKGRGDFDLERFIQAGRYEENDYDFVNLYRLEGYNEWVKQGKPLSNKYQLRNKSHEEIF